MVHNFLRIVKWYSRNWSACVVTQIIRQHGFDIENSTRYCDKCQDKTAHRRLISIAPVESSFIRLQLPSKLRQRVLKHYDNTEAIILRKMISHQLEVDHRFPQVRWSKDEVYDINMTEEELHQKFQLLTRQHNLWKSRYCEHCEKTGERGTFIGINYFHKVGQNGIRKFPMMMKEVVPVAFGIILMTGD
ncbi:MAG: hypothetical protein DDT24_00226 [Chloroflexi bacterium]|nr:hypothetical protein [Chloroflexota bacterium]